MFWCVLGDTKYTEDAEVFPTDDRVFTDIIILIAGDNTDYGLKAMYYSSGAWDRYVKGRYAKDLVFSHLHHPNVYQLHRVLAFLGYRLVFRQIAAEPVLW